MTLPPTDTLLSPGISTARAADADAVVDVITLAFSSDPMARWALPDPKTYLAYFPSIVRAMAGHAFQNGTAHVADRYSGAALWQQPGDHSDEASLIETVEQTAPDGLKEELFAVFEQMARFHPTEPHWYLPLIGVDPTRQGHGTGSALMAHALATCDRDGVIAYLESSNPRNISLYERHGFEVIGEIQAGSSPVLRPMLRTPR